MSRPRRRRKKSPASKRRSNKDKRTGARRGRVKAVRVAEGGRKGKRAAKRSHEGPVDAGAMGCAHRSGMGSVLIVVGSREHRRLTHRDSTVRRLRGDFTSDANSNALCKKKNVLLSTKESQDA